MMKRYNEHNESNTVLGRHFCATDDEIGARWAKGPIRITLTCFDVVSLYSETSAVDKRPYKKPIDTRGWADRVAAVEGGREVPLPRVSYT